MLQPAPARRTRTRARSAVTAVLTVVALFTAQGLAWAGAPTFATHVEYTAADMRVDVRVADFDGDGFEDVVSANLGSDSVSVLLGNGDGSLDAKTDYTVDLAPFGLAAADFDGDGNTDLATANSAGANVSVLPGTGTGTFDTRTDFTVDIEPDTVSVLRNTTT